MIPRRAGNPFATARVLAVCFADLRYFLSQFYDSLFDGTLHDDRLAESSNLQKLKRRWLSKPPSNRRQNLGCQPGPGEVAPLVPLPA
jgi:hypothetical protein